VNDTALIVGAGSGLSGSLARLLAKEGMRVALAARNVDKLAGFDALKLRCDATRVSDVEETFAAVEKEWGIPQLVVYNASFRTRGPFAQLDPNDVKKSIDVTAYAGFLVAQAAAKRMLPRAAELAAQGSARQGGAIFFTGASASVKGYAESAPFAMGKFALRGLAQSMARELQPKGIHVAHFVIDGGIGKDANQAKLDPDEIARNYLSVYRQHRSTWSWEIELRPWVERF
jgi:NAD(P)-dependent dehydrogenase (short-subunit alcohol dehydrogenase family)